MATDTNVLDAAKSYEEPIVRFLRDMIAIPAESGKEGDRFERKFWLSDNVCDYNQPMRPLETRAEDISPETVTVARCGPARAPQTVTPDGDPVDRAVVCPVPAGHADRVGDATLEEVLQRFVGQVHGHDPAQQMDVAVLVSDLP